MLAPVCGNLVEFVRKNSNNTRIAAFSNASSKKPEYDQTTLKALDNLEKIEFDVQDTGYLSGMGVKLPFNSGSDAVDFIKRSNTKISFENTYPKHVFAQYDHSRKLIILNETYKGSADLPVILALAEALIHECGHAKDNDADNSIQEELNNLGMGALAHRAFLKKYGNVFDKSKELIVKDGVNIYSKLFFDTDPDKKKLIKRIRSKYKGLPAGDLLHPPSQFALRVKGSASSCINCNT
jgi:hypothetical protein